MGKEIERKFIVNCNLYKTCCGFSVYRQGYLSLNILRTVRVRTTSDKGFITVKGKNSGAARSEYEYEIPFLDAENMLEEVCIKPIIEKRRYIHRAEDGHIWEIDEFLGDNDGLTIAEIELNDEKEEFEKPLWIGNEVTGDSRYYNSNLVEHPYCKWGKAEID